MDLFWVVAYSGECTLHTVSIKLIHTGFFKDGNTLLNDVGYGFGEFHVRSRIAPDNNRLRTQPFGDFHGHTRMDAKFSGIIAT